MEVYIFMERTYTELSKLKTFEERFEYLKLGGQVGKDTFGFDRWLNQDFYKKCKEYRDARDKVIARDLGCDLGIDGYEIVGRIIVHHMNPIDVDDIINLSPHAIDPEYMIATSHKTHNAIHYGSECPREKTIVTRTPNDTCPWKKGG